MEVLWNNSRNVPSCSGNRNDRHSFEQHAERMRAFCLAHAKTETAGPKGSIGLRLPALMPLYRILVPPRNWQN